MQRYLLIGGALCGAALLFGIVACSEAQVADDTAAVPPVAGRGANARPAVFGDAAGYGARHDPVPVYE